MYVLTFVIIFLVILGAYTQAYIVQTLAINKRQTVVAELMVAWNSAVLDDIQRSGFAEPATGGATNCVIYPPALFPGRRPTVFAVGQNYQTAPSFSSARCYFSVTQGGGPSATYTITWAAPPANPAQPIGGLGVTVADIMRQLQHMKIDNGQYGLVTGGGVTLTTYPVNNLTPPTLTLPVGIIPTGSVVVLY